VLEYRNELEKQVEEGTRALNRKNEKIHWLGSQVKQYETVVQTLQE
jgi:hypothetical protein